MKIAVLSDIHGNLAAFEAALEHVEKQVVDLTVLLGDYVIGAPDSDRCWQLAQSLDCPMLRGNHERYVFDYGSEGADPIWQSEQFGPLHYGVAQFTDAERQAMAKLPTTLMPPDASDLLFVHASARSDRDNVPPYTPGNKLSEMFPDVSQSLILRGHDHLHQANFWGERLIYTISSVGIPLDCNPTAQYCLLEQRKSGWQILPQSVSYDVEATLQRFRETDYVAKAGPMGRLFMREIATATSQMLPFLRLYSQWQAAGSVSLAEAVERFLRL